MFQGMREGSLFYTLTKSREGMSLQIGQVVKMSNPYPKPFNNQNVPQVYPSAFPTTEMVVDVEVKVGDIITPYKQLPANDNLCTYENGRVVVTDSRDVIGSQVEGEVLKSRQVLDDRPYHEANVATGEEIMRSLNPQFAKEKQRDEEMDNLRGRIGGIENTLNRIVGLLSAPETGKSRKTKEE